MTCDIVTCDMSYRDLWSVSALATVTRPELSITQNSPSPPTATKHCSRLPLSSDVSREGILNKLLTNSSHLTPYTLHTYLDMLEESKVRIDRRSSD